MAKLGRAKGSRNRGFFFRKGRGWAANDNSQAIPLKYEDGTPIRDRNARMADVKRAYQRHLDGKQREAQEAAREASEQEGTERQWERLTVADACRLFLDYCKANHAASTYEIRSAALFDFCTGFSPSFRKKKGRPTNGCTMATARCSSPTSSPCTWISGWRSIPVGAGAGDRRSSRCFGRSTTALKPVS